MFVGFVRASVLRFCSRFVEDFSPVSPLDSVRSPALVPPAVDHLQQVTAPPLHTINSLCFTLSSTLPANCFATLCQFVSNDRTNIGAF